MDKGNIFFSIRRLSGPYKFLIESAKIHSEKLLKKKLEIEVCKVRRIDIWAFFLTLMIIFKTNFFSKKKIMNIDIQNYNISRYAVPEIYKNYNTYLSRISFFFESIKVFYSNIVIFRQIINLDKKKIKAAFIDHGMYRNGLAIAILSNKKIPIYTLGYPKGIFYFINKKKNYLNYENIIELKKTKKLKNTENNVAKNAIRRVIDKTDTIPWMKSIKFIKKSKKFDDITHVIYAHTFTDAQMLYGYDGFINVYDWLDFTVQELTKNKKNKIMIKAHPGFFHSKFPTKNMKYDRKLFYKIISKYEKDSKIVVIKEPVKNGELLRDLNKNTILISHHGSAILEGLYSNFKFIASDAAFWSSKFKLSNSWNTRKNYKKVLNKKWKELKKHSSNDLYNVSFQLFCNPLSLYGKYYWQQIISNELKIPRQKVYEDSAFLFDKLKMKKNKFDIITNKISNTIEEVQA